MTVGPVCYSLVAEISSPRLRNKTVVLARNLYNVTGVVANVLTPHMLNPDAWKWDAKAGSFWAGTGASYDPCALWIPSRLRRDNKLQAKPKAKEQTKRTAAGIPTWSPTVVLICRSTAYVWQSGRDAQFSADCGRT
ncbi:hypothetical protein KCU73_g9327, partial [Aureobasidium melanogenum]